MDQAYDQCSLLSGKPKSEVIHDLKFDKFVGEDKWKPAEICEAAAMVLAQMAVYLDSQDNVSVVVLMKDGFEKDK